jgi:type I site-specific restriction endonuclease
MSKNPLEDFELPRPRLPSWDTLDRLEARRLQQFREAKSKLAAIDKQARDEEERQYLALQAAEQRRSLEREKLYKRQKKKENSSRSSKSLPPEKKKKKEKAPPSQSTSSYPKGSWQNTLQNLRD